MLVVTALSVKERSTDERTALMGRGTGRSLRPGGPND